MTENKENKSQEASDVSASSKKNTVRNRVQEVKLFQNSSSDAESLDIESESTSKHEFIPPQVPEKKERGRPSAKVILF